MQRRLLRLDGHKMDGYFRFRTGSGFFEAENEAIEKETSCKVEHVNHIEEARARIASGNPGFRAVIVEPYEYLAEQAELERFLSESRERDGLSVIVYSTQLESDGRIVDHSGSGPYRLQKGKHYDSFVPKAAQNSIEMLAAEIGRL